MACSIWSRRRPLGLAGKALQVQLIYQGGKDVNPETLFGAAYAACFAGALHLCAKQAAIEIPSLTSVTSRVDIGRNESGGLGLQVLLTVRSYPGVEQAALEKLVAKAHTICPYSNAIRGNVPVIFSVVTTKF